MEHISVGYLSIIPPIMAVCLALITKEVFSSLLVGIIAGAFIYTCHTDGNLLIDTGLNTLTVMEDSFDLKIVIFCSLLGAVVYVTKYSGGADAYGKWISQKMNSRTKVKVSTNILAASIFIDDYFNCLTVGTVMKPLANIYKISKEKLAFIIDSTAASICVMAPISSWAAAITSSIDKAEGEQAGMSLFMSSIPWNFYAIFCLAFVFYICCTKFDFGPMIVAERQAKNNPTNDLAVANDTSKDKSKDNTDKKDKPNGIVLDMLLPLLTLIISTFVYMLYTGGFWNEGANLGKTFATCDSSASLVLGGFTSLLVAFLMYVPRKLCTLKSFMDEIVKGVQSMIPANMVLLLAWSISGITKALGAPEFIASIFTDLNAYALVFIPVLIFVFSGFLSFATGTAWGTFGILIPIVLPLAHVLDSTGGNLVVIFLSATLAGSVFGDHCSPISDTTILSSASAGCSHIQHVTTQLPYSLLVASCVGVGYIIAGITQNLILSISGVAVLLVLSVFVIKKIVKAKIGNKTSKAI